MAKQNKLSEAIQNAWDVSFNKFFYEKTNMFYDYVSGKEESLTKHLPTLKEISENYPNPCGWTTGMEDCVLTGGPVLEAIVTEYELTGNLALKEVADKVYDGLYLCATVSKQRGFLARGVSHIDGKSHYINSSRDQYTHWIYCVLKFYHSALASETQKEQIKDILISFAEKAESDVTLDNDLSLLREDGKIGEVSEMFDVWGHETHRLPMIYMAAWVVSKNKHWLEKYHILRNRATGVAERQFDLMKDKKQYPWCYAFLQMQYSVKLLYDYDEDEAYKKRYKKILDYVASLMPYYVNAGMKFVDELKEYSRPIEDWHGLKMCLGWTNRYGDKFCFPETNAFKKEAVYLRNFAEAFMIMTMGEETEVLQKNLPKFKRACKKIDFNKATNYWPTLFVDAYWLIKKKIGM